MSEPPPETTAAGRQLGRVPTAAVAAALSAYWLAMFVGTHLPPSPQPDDRGLDKPIHLLAFFGLSLLLSATLRKLGRPIGVAVPILLAYGAADELSQIPVGRTCELMDWICDAIGTLAGWGFARLLLGHKST